MKNILKTILLPLSIFVLVGCSGNSNLKLEDEGDDSYKGGTYYIPTGEGIETDPCFSMDDKDDDGTEIEEKPTINPGQLTCSALDDNKYYDYWKTLNSKDQEGEHLFYNYTNNFAFKTLNRVNLTINNGKDITVKALDNSFTTKVDNFHKAYLFPSTKQESYEVEISYLDNNDVRKSYTTTVKDNDEIDLENTFVITENLQIMFVIDATGSMGDEMSYIQAEIDDVISNVKSTHPSAHIELAMMVYRDHQDDYVTKYSDFTTDIASQQAFLKKQSAHGGGDFEEAVDVALEEAMKKQWSDNATKLLFHVADAPSHDYDVPSWNNSVIKAASKGIKIISVASSGIDKKTEYFFRCQSLLSAGQYVYLTNHSGIGGEHLDATTDQQLTVEYLNACLIRLISSYYSGQEIEPVSYIPQQ